MISGVHQGTDFSRLIVRIVTGIVEDAAESKCLVKRWISFSKLSVWGMRSSVLKVKFDQLAASIFQRGDEGFSGFGW